jgi:hypothetical protein
VRQERICIVSAADPISARLGFQFHWGKGHSQSVTLYAEAVEGRIQVRSFLQVGELSNQQIRCRMSAGLRTQTSAARVHRL